MKYYLMRITRTKLYSVPVQVEDDFDVKVHQNYIQDSLFDEFGAILEDPDADEFDGMDYMDYEECQSNEIDIDCAIRFELIDGKIIQKEALEHSGELK